MVSRETVGSPPLLPPWLEGQREALTAFCGLLADAGVTRGLIGPREVPRLWQRHILNCAVVAEPSLGLIPSGARIADVGSGAGLPGLVWAIARPDTTVLLIEPLLRRSTFLSEAISELGLGGRAEVRRARAEDETRAPGFTPFDVVTARAVAPLERLIGWTVPLLAEEGRLVALKGSSAQRELDDARETASAAGLTDLRVMEVGEEFVETATTVITGIRRAAQ